MTTTKIDAQGNMIEVPPREDVFRREELEGAREGSSEVESNGTPSPSSDVSRDADSTVNEQPGAAAAGEVETTNQASTQTPAAQTDKSETGEDDYQVLDANIGDQPTAEDSLGFEPYVKAIAGFLTNEVTKPPLTLSVEGEWGSGKSSFMLQLQKKLGKETIISFNAWQYDKDDAMWAAFALESAQQLSRGMPFLRRWWAHLKLFFYRFKWVQGWMDMAKLTLVLTVVLAAVLLPILAREEIKAFVAPTTQTPPTQTTTPSQNAGESGASIDSTIRKLVGAGGALAYLVLVIGLLIKAKGVIGNPLRINLKQHLDTPDYKDRVAFIQRFHEDFARVVKVYGRNEKVFVFIDDLDRCEVPKAADLMQALNLMIADSDRLIFIMGLDREKVAAGLAVKYEKLLPYLAPAATGSGERTTSAFDPVLGLEYGYGFIEKFIQLPFLVPQASDTQVDPFLQKLLGAKGLVAPVKDVTLTPQAAAAGTKAVKAVTENSDMVTEILKMVAPTFDYNPRRLKQFINAFRLKTFIARDTGLFGEPADPVKYDRLTIQQLGKFVAISLRWPLLLADLDNERDLLSRLQLLVLADIQVEDLYLNEKTLKKQIGTGKEQKITITDSLVRWYHRDNLRKLLQLKLVTNGDEVVDEGINRTFSLARLDVNRLLQVSPFTRPSVKQQSAEPPVQRPPVDTSATYPKVQGQN